MPSQVRADAPCRNGADRGVGTTGHTNHSDDRVRSVLRWGCPMDLNRRALLAGSAGTLAGLAGCSGLSLDDGGSGNATDDQGTATDAIRAADSGPARFSKVQIRGPDSVAAGEEFSLTVSAANVGGNKGDFTSTLTIDVEGVQRNGSVKIEDVPPGERKQTTIEGVSLSYVTDVSFLITDFAAEHTVSVTQATRSFGEAFETQEASLTIQDVRYNSTYVVGTGEEQQAFGPQSGDVFGLILLQVEGDGSSLMTNQFSIDGGRPVSGIGNISLDALFENIDAPGQRLTELEGSGQAWVLAEFDAEGVAEPVIEYNVNFSGEHDVRWSGEPSEPAPLVSTTVSGLPDSPEIGTEHTVTIEISNEGEGAADVAGIIQREGSQEIGRSWSNIRTFAIEVPPGTTRTERMTIQQGCVGEARFRVSPLTEPFGVTFTDATRQLGQPFTGPEGIQMTVRKVVMADAFEYPSSFGGTERTEASSGRQWAMINLLVEATGDEDASPPGRDSIWTGYQGQPYKTEGTNKFEDKIVEPFEGPIFKTPFTLSPGERTAGWLAYEVPDGASADDIKVRWAEADALNECKFGANWE